MALLTVEALAPFRLDVPGWRANGANRTATGLAFAGPNRASTPEPPEWLEDVRHGAPFEITLVAAASTFQPQVARILTVSGNYTTADLVVAQYQRDLLVRLRWSGSDLSGEPPLRVPAVFDQPTRRRVVVRRVGSTVDVAVDGAVRATLDVGPDGLRQWRTDHRLALGDEHLGSRAWRGTLDEATVRVDDRRWDYLREGLRIPGHFWYLPERLRAWTGRFGPFELAVAGAHAVSFAVLGAIALAADPHRRRRRAILLVLAVDVLLVAGKVLVATRHPTALDLVTQAAGGMAGVTVVDGILSPGALVTNRF